MFSVFIVVQILLTLAMVALILVQRNDSDGLGSMGGGGGGGNAFMTGRGAANLMTRTTAILATLFMLNSLLLAILASNNNGGTSIANQIEADSPTVSVPLADDVPATDPQPISPEMPAYTTTEPEGEPVTGESEPDAVQPTDEADMNTPTTDAVPTP